MAGAQGGLAQGVRLNVWQRAWLRASSLALTLARVTPVLPGRAGDGLVTFSSGTELDKPWRELYEEFTGARECWQNNPLGRRLVNLVSSFVCGDGIALTSDRPDLAAFLTAFWNHPNNQLKLRQYAWCDELTRAGELFITLHMNPVDGMSYVRALPASAIDRVLFDREDYERETAYHEQVGADDPDYPAGRTWWAAEHPLADDPTAWADAARPRPVALHFAVNRPVGCVRGESDLAPVLAWLKRYSRWLEDRVTLNTAVRSFLWIVKVPDSKLERRKAALATPPESGTVMVVDRDNETWEAVAPSLHANDAAADGRAIRWMIVAGGPGVGLVDMGEGEEANLATAKAMGEQRSRFMRARQQYFADALATVALTAYNRAVRLGLVVGQAASLADIRVGVPDISPADNGELGASAQAVAAALAAVNAQGVRGAKWRRLVVRTVLRFAGETLDEAELGEILAESSRDSARESRDDSAGESLRDSAGESQDNPTGAGRQLRGRG